MKRIKITLVLLVCFLIASLFYHHKSSYYGYTKSYFNSTPDYIRPHFRGPDLGNLGFSIVQHDIDWNVIGPFGKTRIKGGGYVYFKHILGYYYTNDNLIVEGIDKDHKSRLVLIKPENFKDYFFDLLDAVPKDEGYKHVVIPEGKYTYYITNYLKIVVFILIVLLLYFWIKLKKKKK